MRADIWIERASAVESFDGKGHSANFVAAQTGLTVQTIRRYAEKFGFDFTGRCSALNGDVKYAARVERIKELAAKGMTRTQVAEAMGINARTVGNIGRQESIQFRHAGLGSGVDHRRAEAMAAMFKGGKTLQEIGDMFSVTRERVRQIIKKHHNLVGRNGGKQQSSQRRREAAKVRRDAENLAKHGCSHDDYQSLVRMGKALQAEGVGFYRTPIGAFTTQRNNAVTRGIEFKLKIWEWWGVWVSSGQWENRGRSRGEYCMCRFGDIGAYEIGNVYIAKCDHNTSFQPNNPYRKGHPDHEEAVAKMRKSIRTAIGRRPRASVKRVHKDLPIGVTRKNDRLIAQITINGKSKYLGYFDTVEEAHAAYLAALSEIEAGAAA